MKALWEQQTEAVQRSVVIPSGANTSVGLVDNLSFWGCSLRAAELNFELLLEGCGQKIYWKHSLSGRNHGDVIALGNMPFLPPLLLQVDSDITPMTSRELGWYETGNNAVFK